MRSLEEASRRYITARISQKQRVALYNESVADLESIINEADKVKIKKMMNEGKTEKLAKINTVKTEREMFLTVRYVMKSGAKYKPRKVDGKVYIRTQKEYKIMPNEKLKIDMVLNFRHQAIL